MLPVISYLCLAQSLIHKREILRAQLPEELNDYVAKPQDLVE